MTMVNKLSPALATEFDFAAPELYGRHDIHEIWAAVRREAPVLRCESAVAGFPFWVVTSYPAVRAVLADGKSFTSERGMMLLAPADGDPAGGRMLVATDPPRHTALRRLFAHGLSRAVLERARMRVQATVERLLDAAEGHEIDFVDEVSAPIPVAAIAALLGVPAEDEAFLYTRTRLAFAAEDEAESGGVATAAARGQAHVDILVYFDHLLREKRTRGGDAEDLLTVLACGTVDDEPLSVDDVLVNCDNVLLGGNETARYALAGAVLSMIEDEASWHAAYATREVTKELVDELLRWTSPGQHVMRVARRDLTLLGETIRAGERVTCWIPAANRDTTVFERGDRLDLARRPNPHLTFGGGHHSCWGAAFAQMELAEVVGALLRRRLRPRPAGKPQRVRSTVMNGLRSLPVVLERA